MPILNAEIADLFNKVADLLEIEGANPFRVRAYRNAARTIGGLARNVTEMIADKTDLTQLSGIGKDLAAKIAEIVATGRLSKLEQLEKRLPPGLHQILKLPGLGPKRVKTLYEHLNIGSIDDLKRAAEKGGLHDLEGFGTKTEKKLLREISRLGETSERIQWITAEMTARPLLDYLQAAEGIQDIIVAGSFRRRKETVGDLDILATCKSASQLMQRFVDYEDVRQTISRGETRSSVVLRSGLQVDLRVVPRESYGAALHYFTGSKAHNIAVRRLGQKKGLKINEYGVFKGQKKIAGRTEEEVFARVGLPFIAPELREDRGEIQAAMENRLPRLVQLDHLLGDLHCHTDDSDGRNTLAEMIAAARGIGYEYIAVTNHSQNLRIAKGMKPDRVLRLIEKIDRLNSKSSDFVVFKSMEVDILKDGALDLPHSVLQRLDFTVCSIHTDFNLPREKQTARVLRAMDNPHFNILGHPSGRLINQRRPYAIDLEQVIAAAEAKGCFMELNAHPDRLDLDDIYCRLAKESGVLVAISTDAHDSASLKNMRLGVAQARRGWLEPADVLNSRSADALRKLFKR